MFKGISFKITHVPLSAVKIPLWVDHGLQTNHWGLWVQPVTGRRGFFLLLHAYSTRCSKKCVDVGCLIVLLSLPGTELSSRLCFVSQGLIQTHPAQHIQSQPSGMPTAFLHSSSYWEEDQQDNGQAGSFGREPEKGPRPLDNTYKQIFLHAINKKQVLAFQMSLQRGKILLLLFYAFKETSFLDGALFTHFPLNFAVSANHPTSEKAFCLMWWFQNTDPCAEAIFSFNVEEKFLRSLQNLYFPSCQIKNEFAPAHMQVFRLHLGPCTENQLNSLQHLVHQCKELLQQGWPGTSWDKKTSLCLKILRSVPKAGESIQLFFSYMLVERSLEDRLTSSNNSLQKIYHHKFF